MKNKLGQLSKELNEELFGAVDKAGAFDKVDLIVKKVCIDMFTDIVLTTPKDTGRATANWSLDITDQNSSAISSRPTKNVDEKNNPERSERGIKHAMRETSNLGKKIVENGNSVYIYNNVKYIDALESGTSTQAPEGFVNLALKKHTRRFK